MSYSVINPLLQVGCLAGKAEKVEREREQKWAAKTRKKSCLRKGVM
jgi:hypothetical protein